MVVAHSPTLRYDREVENLLCTALGRELADIVMSYTHQVINIILTFVSLSPLTTLLLQQLCIVLAPFPQAGHLVPAIRLGTLLTQAGHRYRRKLLSYTCLHCVEL